MVRALVVDDEAVARRRLSELLVELGVTVAAAASTADEALRVVDRGRIDAAFLDIRLPGGDGLALGDRFHRSGLPVVFVTGFPDYALAAFDVGAADYLLKPISRDRLGRALARLRTSGVPTHKPGGVPLIHDRLCLRVEGGRVLVPVRQILYARRDAGITTLHLEDGTVRNRLTLEALERALQPQGFFRSHRAFLVNLRRVRRIIPWSRDAQSLLLDDPKETHVPLAKSRLQELRANLIWP